MGDSLMSKKLPLPYKISIFKDLLVSRYFWTKENFWFFLGLKKKGKLKIQFASIEKKLIHEN